MKPITFSFLPLTDAAPILVAHAKGWFREQGLASALRREGSWTSSRDSLNRGEAQAAHMLFSMPVAGACGLLGHGQAPLVIPWVLSRNGQAITLNRRYLGAAGADAKALKSAALAGRDVGRPLVFGHTLRVGTHAMLLRYWLAAGGIDPERDVALITVPPPQMVENMRGGRMDGFCVGEPWNARAQQAELGYTAITSGDIWRDHPEKVCAFTAAFTQENPDTVVAILQVLHRAGEWLGQPANHDEAAALLARPEHLNCDAAPIRARLSGPIDFGDGRYADGANGLAMSGAGLHRPSASAAIWYLTQFRRWGLLFGEPDYAAVAERTMRCDLHERALAGLGIASEESPMHAEIFCDGVAFDPSAPADYVRRLACSHLQG